MPRPTTLPEPWRSLAETLERQWVASHPGQSSPGGVTLLADALHSDVSTIRRWSAGTRQPRGPALALIAALFRRCEIEPPE